MSKRNYLILTSLKKKLTSKWFIGMNIFILIALLLIFNMGNIIALFGGDFQKEKTIILIDNSNNYEYLKEKLEKHSKDLSSVSEYTVTNSSEDAETIKERIKNNNNLFLLIVNPDEENYLNAEIYSNTNISYILRNFILASLNDLHHELAINDSGLSPEELAKINSGVNLDNYLVETQGIATPSNKHQVTNNGDTEVGAIVMVVMILPFFFLIVTLVQMIGAEINEEKTSKSMEYIITNVSPTDHLMAKIISCTGFIITQILGVVISVGIASFVKSQSPSIVTDTSKMLSDALHNFVTPEILANIVKILPIVAIFFLITLVSYAVCAAVLASMTTNIDDFQQLQTPLMLIVSIGFYLSIFAIIYNGSHFIKIMSFVPLVSLLISPALYMLGEASILSVVIAMLIQLAFLVLVFKKGMKVYKVGILNYSGEHLWKKIFKALKS
ncbi:MAG: ABC transporter permease [Bacilli bacterium]|nr:ABC transporter permease [Bacilli bacterium]